MKKRMLAAAVLTAIAIPSVPLTGSAERSAFTKRRTQS